VVPLAVRCACTVAGGGVVETEVANTVTTGDVVTGILWLTDSWVVAMAGPVPPPLVRVANSPSERNSGSGVGGLKRVVIRGASGSAPSSL